MDEDRRLARTQSSLDPQFVDGPSGQLLFTFFRPPSEKDSKTAVLCLPPFAEEMNKSRRMLSQLGRRVAGEGTLFLLPDLYGTGDSAGEFGDACHKTWCDDVSFTTQWLRSNGFEEIRFLAVRYGCLLMSHCLAAWEQPKCRIVLWDPVLSGKALLNQFLRARIASEMQSGKATSVAELRNSAAKEGSIEVAGYEFTDRMIKSMDEAQFDAEMPVSEAEVLWTNTGPVVDMPPPAPVQSLISKWRDVNASVTYQRVGGAQFWMSPEIQDVPELLDITADFLGARM